MHKVISDSSARWAQDNYYHYMQPIEAHKFADTLDTSLAVTTGKFILGIFIPQPYGAILGGGSILGSAYRGELAQRIRTQSNYCPVAFTIVKHSYGSGYSQVRYWDGKYVNVSNESSGLIKYKSRQLLLENKIKRIEFLWITS